MNTIRLITDKDVATILDMKNTLRCVENAYRQKANKQSYILPVVSADLIRGKADMDIKSGIYQSGNIYGLKLVSWFGDNEGKGLPALTGMLMIFDLENGFPKALINARYLTAMRTGAAGAIGVQYLAKKNAENLLVVGTGYQAIYQIAATLSAVPTIHKVYLCNPRNVQKAKMFQKSIYKMLREMINDVSDEDNQKWYERIEEVTFVTTDDLQSVLQEVDVVITVTPSNRALIQKEWIKKGTHFSCIGADLPGKQEIDEGIIENAKVYTEQI